MLNTELYMLHEHSYNIYLMCILRITMMNVYQGLAELGLSYSVN